MVGGTGFVGSHLCKQAIQDGWKVSSLSRRGTPDSCKDPKRSAWMSKINWIKGDVMHPETYTAQLSGVDTVVHSMGVILENPYYQDIALHPINTACTFYKNGSLPEKPFRTYAEANRDSAIILAETCMKFENIKNFVYMSANHAVPPFLPGGYIKAKIETENSLAVLPLHTLIIRPSKPTIFLIF